MKGLLYPVLIPFIAGVATLFIPRRVNAKARKRLLYKKLILSLCLGGIWMIFLVLHRVIPISLIASVKLPISAFVNGGDFSGACLSDPLLVVAPTFLIEMIFRVMFHLLFLSLNYLMD